MVQDEDDDDLFPESEEEGSETEKEDLIGESEEEEEEEGNIEETEDCNEEKEESEEKEPTGVQAELAARLVVREGAAEKTRER